MAAHSHARACFSHCGSIVQRNAYLRINCHLQVGLCVSQSAVRSKAQLKISGVFYLSLLIISIDHPSCKLMTTLTNLDNHETIDKETPIVIM